MTELSEKIGQFLNRRKSVVSEILNRGGEQEAALLKAYGAPSAVDAMVSGAEQGALHGFADDIERSSRGDGVAQSQIRAKAANPVAYEIATLIGTMAAAGGLRGGLALLGKQASATARGASRVSGAAGSAQIAAKAADRAQRIEAKIATLGMKPQTRGMVMDAAHGAAWGYGGSDVSADEKGGLNPERLLRAALGAGGATVAAPLTASAAVAGTNIPLTWGARRLFSKRMLEPPGVTKMTPAGRPRDSIEIARSRDESAARASSGGPGIIARDTARPMESNFPNVQKLADQSLAPIAPTMIDTLRGKQRNAAADAMVAAYPDVPGGGPQPGNTQKTGTGLTSGEMTVLNMKRMGTPLAQIARKLGFRRDEVGLPEVKSFIENQYAAAIKKTTGGGVRKRVTDTAAFLKSVLGNTADRTLPKQPRGTQMQLDLQPQRDPAEAFVGQMMEAFVRKDRPALESWVSTLEAAWRKDPTIKTRVQAAVARQLAINERANPELNNDLDLRAFLYALGMSGNKAKGIPNVLDAARAPAREQFPTQRYEDAITRTADDTPMRPRHAEALRKEMEGFEPGPYTGPADARRGPPLVARGDDEPYWLNPLNFLQDGKVNDAEVNMAGFISGPVAYGIERLGVGPATQFAMGDPEDVQTEIDAPPPRPIAARGALADVRPQQPRPAALPAPVAPRGAFAPLPEAMPPAPAPAAPAVQPAVTSGEPVRDIQTLLMQAGIDVGPEGDDGQLGPNTQAAMQAFARITNMPGQITPERVLARLQAYPRDALAEDLARALAQ